jgi:hypothetical protein
VKETVKQKVALKAEKSKYPKPAGPNGGYTEKQIRDMFAPKKK